MHVRSVEDRFGPMKSLLQAALRMRLFWSLVREVAQRRRYHMTRVPKLSYPPIW